MNELINMLLSERISYAEHCPIAKYSTYRIGRTARLAVFPKSREQMIKTLSAIRKQNLTYAVVGKGSNLLFPDGEYDGVIVFTTGMQGIECADDRMDVLAGTSLAAVSLRAGSLSLSGAEFAAGIPGTVGGAVLMNAGAYGGSMEQIVTYVECLNTETGVVERYGHGEHGFGYRTSRYACEENSVILQVGVQLHRGDSKAISELMSDYRRRRIATQPLEYPNCGSVFKNPEGYSAGKLIEACGLKGANIGGAYVSEKHANFIVNKGEATAQDVKELIAFVRQTVEKRTGISLMCELRGLGFGL